jgi:hypothetical protein
MSSLTGLSKRQVQVLWAAEEVARRNRAASGPEILGRFRESALDAHAGDASVQGVHQTAASLVRKRALDKMMAWQEGGRPVVCYRPTAHGRALLKREVEVHGRPL